MDENNVNLMDKKLDDLTIRDTVKINLVVIAATVAFPVVILAGVAAVEGIKSKIRARKTKTPDIIIPTELEK